MISPMTRLQIHHLRDAGLSQAQIAQHTLTSERSVRTVLSEPPPTPDELQAGRLGRPHGGRPSTVAPFAERIVALLRERPDLPTTEVLRIATSVWGYAGGRSALFAAVARLRPPPTPEPVVCFDGLSGEFAQFDFGECVVRFADGSTRKIHIFVGRLKYSRLLHVVRCADQQAETLIRGVVACLDAFGGSPKQWVFDNPKTVRISRPGEVIRLHPYLQHLAGELRVAVELCTPRRGNEKGSVERGVGFVKNSFLLVRHFIDLADLDAQLAAWLAQVNDHRVHDGTKEIPRERWRREQARLAERPAPATADAYALRETLTASPMATVTYRTTPDQVDPRAIGTAVTALVRRDTIELITVRGTRCTHRRCDGTRIVQRLPGQPQALLAAIHGERKQNYFRRQCLLELGPAAERFLEEVIHRHAGGSWSGVVNRLFDLLERHGRDAMRVALERCLAQGRCDLFAVTAALKGAA